MLKLTLHHITKPNQLTILFNKIAETLGIFGVAKKNCVSHIDLKKLGKL